MKRRNTIGIVGGAGPMAAILLTKKIIATCQKIYGCKNDNDFPKIILISYPFSEMLKPNTLQQRELTVSEQLKEALDFLIDNGADFLGIACNTLHGFLGDKYKKQLINLINETRDYLSENKIAKPLILCTSTSVKKNIHDFSLSVLPNPKSQVIVDELIQVILGGTFSLQDSLLLKECILSKVSDDPKIDGVVLGCSELSVLLDEFPVKIPGIKIIDPLDILSSKLCACIFQTEGD